ncbi:MAG: cell division protein ZapA [Bacilli bacterium]|nr:cell division protein ZapA [Bacilli bacterium]
MSAEEKTRISVDIFGTSYKLVGSSSVSYMKMVAAHVNDQMHHISAVLPLLESSKVAVLASVNIADEFFKLRKENEQFQSEKDKHAETEAKLRKLTEQQSLLEQQLIEAKDKQARTEERRIQAESGLRGVQAELQETQKNHQDLQDQLQALKLDLVQAQEEQAKQREALIEHQQQVMHSESAEQQKLQDENAALRRELEQERQRWTHQKTEDQDLAHDHQKLTIEYEKLKKEYNEWIELVMEKEEPN